MQADSSTESLPEKTKHQPQSADSLQNSLAQKNPFPSPAGSSLHLPSATDFSSSSSFPHKVAVQPSDLPHFQHFHQRHPSTITRSVNDGSQSMLPPNVTQASPALMKPFRQPSLPISNSRRDSKLPAKSSSSIVTHPYLKASHQTRNPFQLASNLHWRLKNISNGLLHVSAVSNSSGYVNSSRNAAGLLEDTDSEVAAILQKNQSVSGRFHLSHNHTGNTCLYRARSCNPNIKALYPASETELLVPVRIEYEVENGYMIRDLITWNIYDQVVTPKIYADILLSDLKIGHLHKSLETTTAIAKLITEQIDFYVNLINEIEAKNASELPINSYIPIQIELQIGRRLVRDKFIWDSSAQNPVTPEDYARIFCQDYGLGGDNAALMASCIREQILLHFQQNSFASTTAANGGISTDVSLLDFNEVGISNQLQLSKTVVVDQLNEEEVRQLLTKNDRQSRRLRRETTRMKRSNY